MILILHRPAQCFGEENQMALGDSPDLLRIRPAQELDFESIKSIYGFYVLMKLRASRRCRLQSQRWLSDGHPFVMPDCRIWSQKSGTNWWRMPTRAPIVRARRIGTPLKIRSMSDAMPGERNRWAASPRTDRAMRARTVAPNDSSPRSFGRDGRVSQLKL